MKKKTWIGLGSALFIFILLCAYGASALRAQMEAVLSSACGRPVRVQSAQVTLPPGIRIGGITVPALAREPAAPLRIEEIQARLGVRNLLRGRQGLELEIRRPKLQMAWTPQARSLFSMAGLKGTSSPTALPLARLRVEGGEVTLTDETVIPATDWNLRDVRVEISAGPGPGEYRYRFSGLLFGEAGEDLGSLEAEGAWISGGPVDGRGSIRHRDLRFLAPYLRRVLGAAPSQGRAELNTRLTVHQGVVMARNDVTAEGVVFPIGAGTTLDLEGNRLVELLRDGEGKVHLEFIVSGKLGQKLNWSDLAAGALREAMRQAMSRGIQDVLKRMEQIRPAEDILREKFDSTVR